MPAGMRASLIGLDRGLHGGLHRWADSGTIPMNGLVPATSSDCIWQKPAGLAPSLVFIYCIIPCCFSNISDLATRSSVESRMASSSRSGREADGRPITPDSEPLWERSSRSHPTSTSKSVRSGSRPTSQVLYRRVVASPPIKLVPKCTDPSLLFDEDSEPDLAPGLEEDILSVIKPPSTTSSARSVVPKSQPANPERNNERPPGPSVYYPTLPLPSPSKRTSHSPYPATPESKRRRPGTPSTITTPRSQQPSPDTIIFSPSASRSGRLRSISPSPIPRVRSGRHSNGRSNPDTDDTRETETYSDERTRVASCSDHHLYHGTDPEYSPEEDYEGYEEYREQEHHNWELSRSQSQSQPNSNHEIERYMHHPNPNPNPTQNPNSNMNRTNMNQPHFNPPAPAQQEPNPLGPPCRACRAPSTLSLVSHFNRNGNAGRPFYKCPRPECHVGFVTWADRVGIERGNPDCDCGRTSRRGLTGECAWRGPGKVFYKCAEGRCGFWAGEGG